MNDNESDYETAIDPSFVKEKIDILENFNESNIELFIEACEVLCDLSIIDSQVNVIYQSNIIPVLLKRIKQCTELIQNTVSKRDIYRIIEVSFSIISNLSSYIEKIIDDISTNTEYIDIIFDSFTKCSDPSVLIQIVRFLIICVSSENTNNRSIWYKTFIDYPILLEYCLFILNNTLDNLLYDQITQFIFHIILNDEILVKMNEFKCIDIIFAILNERRRDLTENLISNSLKIIECYSYVDNYDYIPNHYTNLLMKIAIENYEDEEILVSCLVILTNMYYNRESLIIPWDEEFFKLIIKILRYREDESNILLECSWKILEMNLSQNYPTDKFISNEDLDELIIKRNPIK